MSAHFYTSFSLSIEDQNAELKFISLKKGLQLQEKVDILKTNREEAHSCKKGNEDMQLDEAFYFLLYVREVCYSRLAGWSG